MINAARNYLPTYMFAHMWSCRMNPRSEISGVKCICNDNSNSFGKLRSIQNSSYMLASNLWVTISMHLHAIGFGIFCFFCQYGRLKKKKLLWKSFSFLFLYSPRLNPPSDWFPLTLASTHFTIIHLASKALSILFSQWFYFVKIFKRLSFSW